MSIDVIDGSFGWCYNESVLIQSKLKKDAIEKPFSKVAIDIMKKSVSVGGEFHIDCAEELVENGSSSKDVWGINIYPDGHIDFISLINIRPAQGNKTMDITNESIRASIEKIMRDLVID